MRIIRPSKPQRPWRHKKRTIPVPNSTATAPQPPETILVHSVEVACDGGEGALGHPRVYLHMDETGRVECPYCDRLFVLQIDSAH